VSTGHGSLYSFSDGENYVQIDENVRGARRLRHSSRRRPRDDNLMELLIMLDAFKRLLGAARHAVLRTQRSPSGPEDKRRPITSKLVADLITRPARSRAHPRLHARRSRASSTSGRRTTSSRAVIAAPQTLELPT